ncbi:hypothetical protein CYMTET_20934 [Cymbomonas tetramitiformis]|uniref:Uncharacterized protein n=1 Tax=Cymbomonas tetramitiformis TaxID=36881 RepID=A0AAE0G329_9CHLO|nr:hypothetical protein CYMTET_20934 [Cymbomonas tetramitiformis]
MRMSSCPTEVLDIRRDALLFISGTSTHMPAFLSTLRRDEGERLSDIARSVFAQSKFCKIRFRSSQFFTQGRS